MPKSSCCLYLLQTNTYFCLLTGSFFCSKKICICNNYYGR
nr:MAG TPA: hypothetical protein [Crassvirales sp.]